MANQRKPSIVFVHGLWADGSAVFARPLVQRWTSGGIIGSLGAKPSEEIWSDGAL
jgi:hypothetical protein